MTRRTLILVLAVLSACTADGGPRASRPAEAPAPTVSPDEELRAAVTQYADCLRREGVDASAPSFDEAGRVTAWPTYPIDAAAAAAERACRGDISELAFRPRGEAAVFLERGQQFADCMAENGVTDVEVSLENGIVIGPSRSNRTVRRAERECRHFVEAS